MTPEERQANLTAAETAYHQLMTGTKAVTVSYAMGDGSRSVTYNQASAENLRGYINQLQRELGLTQGRRAYRPVF